MSSSEVVENAGDDCPISAVIEFVSSMELHDLVDKDNRVSKNVFFDRNYLYSCLTKKSKTKECINSFDVNNEQMKMSLEDKDILFTYPDSKLKSEIDIHYSETRTETDTITSQNVISKPPCDQKKTITYYNCLYCNKKFELYRSYTSHLERDHNKVIKKSPWRYCICGERTKWKLIKVLNRKLKPCKKCRVNAIKEARIHKYNRKMAYIVQSCYLDHGGVMPVIDKVWSLNPTEAAAAEFSASICPPGTFDHLNNF